ncbi:MAG: hypothetical protein AMK72_01040 [Planctomycetes bacterium SM23_25]|nr:MAG: hypothetical protein AMS14_00650 [Planctomycetes bacterium DG_20]KPK50917.1 MAG: hypothetical protein AMK72_01040 [Planctomycetes bacterium SM23_25]
MADRPALVAQLWAKVKPGGTVVLRDGTYTGADSMIAPPRGLSGTPEAPITVRAASDGRVTLDGQSRRVPVALGGNDWFVVEGVNAHSSRDTVVSLSRSNRCIIRRVCGWDAADGNTNVFGAHHGEHNLFEDCAGWGISRKTFSCSQGGNYTVFRRCFALWEGCHNVGPKMSMTLFYNSHHVTAENCIATWDGRRMREAYTVHGQDGKPFTGWKDGSGRAKHLTGYGVDQPYGCFSADRIDNGPTKEPSMFGCIAYILASQRVAPIRAAINIHCKQPGDGWFENTAAFVEEGARQVTPLRLTNSEGRGLTAVGSLEPSIRQCTIDNVLHASGAEGRAAWKAMLRKEPPARGAHIYYRYENGKLTGKPLWPWPMNERLKTLTGLDVTATVFGLGGP